MEISLAEGCSENCNFRKYRIEHAEIVLIFRRRQHVSAQIFGIFRAVLVGHWLTGANGASTRG